MRAVAPFISLGSGSSKRIVECALACWMILFQRAWLGPKPSTVTSTFHSGTADPFYLPVDPGELALSADFGSAGTSSGTSFMACTTVASCSGVATSAPKSTGSGSGGASWDRSDPIDAKAVVNTLMRLTARNHAPCRPREALNTSYTTSAGFVLTKTGSCHTGAPRIAPFIGRPKAAPVARSLVPTAEFVDQVRQLRLKGGKVLADERFGEPSAA